MAKIALMFMLDKASLPENFGMKVSVESTASFYDVLLRDVSLTKLAYPDCTAYCLRLFRKPFAVDMLIVEMDLEYHSRDNIARSCRAKAAEILKVKEDQPFFHPDYLHRAMWLPRGVAREEFSTMVASFSGQSNVDPDQLPRLDGRDSWIMSHPDGFILGSKNESDFLRGLVLYSTAMAYQLQLRDFTGRLSQAASTASEQLPGYVRDISRFMAWCYFSNPIQPAARQSWAEYAHLAGNMRFDELEQQLSSKIRYCESLTASAGSDSAPVAGLSAPLLSEPRYDSNNASKESGSRVFNWLLLLVILVGAGVGLLFYTGMLSADEYPQLLPQWLDLFREPAAPAGESG